MPSLRFWPDRFGTAARRLAVGVALGLVVTLVLTHRWSWTLRGLAGWCCGCGAYLTMCGLFIFRSTPAQTRARCRLDDASRPVVTALLTVATVFSFVGVGQALRDSSAKHGLPTAFDVGIPTLAVVLAWLLVHTLYALHYARLYYANDDDPDGPATGGMDLHEDPPQDPDYQDFLYVAFAVACTYGVTDTVLTSKAARRTVTHHGILSFVLSTVVLALAVNVITNVLAGGG